MMPARERTLIDQATRPFFAGVDVGGTGTKIGIVDDNGRILAKTKIATEEETGPEDAIRRIKIALDGLIQELGIAASEVVAVGLGTPGAQDLHRGYILDPPNLPHWRFFPIRDRLGEACGLPCSFLNDANAAAFGEFWVGSGRNYNSMVMFTLGTGVGGGIILNGELVNGENSFGSELGHLVIDWREEARNCVWGGGKGQLEAYASASAVVARARESLNAGASSSVKKRMADGESLTARLLFEEAERDDPFSLEIILETARFLGVGVTSIVHALDPGAVVIGGAMTFGGHEAKTGSRFLSAVREEFLRRAFDVVAHTVIDYALLGSDAGFIGAAGFARTCWHRSQAPAND